MESDEFYVQIRKDCEKWEQTEQGKAFLKDQLETEIRKVKENNKEFNENFPIPTIPRIIRQRQFGDFYANLINVRIELVDDYGLVFSVPKIDFPRIIYTFKSKNINVIYKTELSNVIVGLFFDSPITHKDKIKVLKKLSNMVEINLLLSERNLFRPFDIDLIMGEDKDGNIFMNEWEDYFLFNNYFLTQEYLDMDKYNYHSLPCNNFDTLTKSDKRLHLIQWD